MVIENQFDRAALFGNLDANIKKIEEHFGVQITERGSEFIVTGERKTEAERVIRELIRLLTAGETLDAQKISYVIALAEKGMSYRESDLNRDII